MIDERKLVVVSAPSGCGKDTVVRHLMSERPDVVLSVSCTTRQPRPGEVDGVDYYFITEEDFLHRIESDRMLEYTRYAGNWYGTPLDELEARQADGNTVVLVIEVEGAGNVKARFPNALCVFVVPPSLEALEQRLRARGTETEEQIEKRLAIAAEELKSRDRYDVSIVNDVVADCAAELSDLIDRWQTEE